MTPEEIQALIDAKVKEELKKALEQFKTKTEALEVLINENTHFNKRLITALLACEAKNNLTLLPSGKFYDKEIS